VKHLLVTNDFPPKIGGIQSYLWELWRRLDPATFVVYTSAHADAHAWDNEQPFEVVRSGHRWLVPTPSIRREIEVEIKRHDIDFVVLDPALPLGALGSSLSVPYATIVHGAEVTVPGRIAPSRLLLGRQLAGSALIIAAGDYVADEARHAMGARMHPPIVNVPPGVDTDLFGLPTLDSRSEARAKWGVASETFLVGSLSRLVPRKGMDQLIEGLGRLAATGRNIEGIIAGDGRDRQRLQRLIDRTGAPVRLVGRIQESDKVLFYAGLDLFAMLCRNRWGGLEQEGFGIVFGEAMASGLACVAGDSGGAADAVANGVSGTVVRRPDSTYDVTLAIGRLADDAALRKRYANAGRERAVELFDYKHLAQSLTQALERVGQVEHNQERAQ
jgi:phosphatidylinositol alpha-1,6-mannosyltransferase